MIILEGREGRDAGRERSDGSDDRVGRGDGGYDDSDGSASKGSDTPFADSISGSLRVVLVLLLMLMLLLLLLLLLYFASSASRLVVLQPSRLLTTARSTPMLPTPPISHAQRVRSEARSSSRVSSFVTRHLVAP